MDSEWYNATIAIYHSVGFHNAQRRKSPEYGKSVNMYPVLLIKHWGSNNFSATPMQPLDVML